MTQELMWTYAFNLVVNSILAFLTIAILIQLCIFVFRVKQPRFKALLLCIPLVKLALDPFLYDFQNWALLHQVNPLEAETGSRTLSVMFCFPFAITDLFPLSTAVQLSVNDGQTFTPADAAALSVHPAIVKGIILLAGSVSFVLFMKYIFRLGRSARALSRLAQNASPCLRPVQNLLLIRKMKQTDIRLIMSSDIMIPCAFGVFRKRICLPAHLIESLSQDEFEAIIAHELDHLCWYDGAIRVLCQMACSLFWWVPAGWWLNRMEHTQEKACDAKISKFNIAGLDLASAIIKTAKTAKMSAPPLLSTYFVQDSLISKRLQPLLEEPVRKQSKVRWLQIVLVSIVAATIFLGRFWIF